jgi:predicted HTH domain antitoxin
MLVRTLNINIPISEEVLFVLKKDEKTLQEEARKILALQFFKERKLSLGKAAGLAGMDKNEFVILLGKNQIDIYQYTEKKLEKEFEFIDRLVEDLKK